MTLSVRYNTERNFVESKVTGVVSAEELGQETEQAIAMGLANDCFFFLSDFSEAEANFSTFDVYELPALQDERGLDRCAQIALIAPRSESGRELADFYETVCFNRSWSARVFTDREAALEWLIGR